MKIKKTYFTRKVFFGIALGIVIFDLNAGFLFAEEAGVKIDPMMIADFEETDVLARIGTSGGVTITLTEKDAVSGKYALEVRVAPFSTHKNSWPAVVLGPNFFTSPIDVSSYSRLSITIKHVTEGLYNVRPLWSTLPYNDGGRNLEGEKFLIPGGTTWDCSFPTDGFKNKVNDPSSIALLYIIFPVAETETVYRIDAIQAIYDPIFGSPAEKLKKQAQDLRSQLETLKQKINWPGIPQSRQAMWRQKLADLETDVHIITPTTAQAGKPIFMGKYNATKEKMDDLSRQMGEFLFADKKDFVAWEINPYINILKNEFPDVKSKVVEKIECQMARNEFRNKVFMVSSCGNDLNLEVKFEGAEHFPAKAVELFETRYLTNSAREVTGDPLYPIVGPLTVPNGESRQITLRFNTRTENIKPGTNAFKVILRDIDTKVEKVIPGALVVWDFVLPGHDVLPNNSFVLLDSSEFSGGELMAMAVADMKTFGMNIVYIHQVDMPKITEIDVDGNVKKVNNERFNDRMSQVLKAWKATPGAEKLQFIFSISGMYDLGVKGLNQPFPNEKWQKVLGQWIEYFVGALEPFGLSYTDWVIAVGDEASEALLLTYHIPAAEAIKAANPNIRTWDNTSAIINDPAMTKRFYKAFDVLEPHLPEFKSNPSLNAWIRNSDRTLGTYKCLSNMAARGKNVYEYYRVFGWDVVKYDLTGIGIWTYCAKGKGYIVSGNMLVYKNPDRDELLHTRRYTFYQEGINDYRYIWKLRETAKSKGPEAVQAADKLIQAAVADVTANVMDTTRCDYWRGKIAGKIIKLESK